MFNKLISRFLLRRMHRQLAEAYDLGLTNGYTLGFEARKCDILNRAYIVRKPAWATVQRQLDEILRRGGF